MQLTDLIAFTVAFALVVASPGPGLAAILSRALASGVRAGLMVVAGLAIVDVLFLAIAVLGLSAVAVLLGPWFVLAKYAAAAYLVYIGISMLRSAGQSAPPPDPQAQRGGWRDVMLGSLVTLGNPKAIMFYAALLPALFDVTALGVASFATLCVVMMAVSFDVYGVYILVARSVAGRAGGAWLRRLAGASMVGAGVTVAARS